MPRSLSGTSARCRTRAALPAVSPWRTSKIVMLRDQRRALAGSKIRLVCMREVRALIVVECKPVLGADPFRPFAAVAQIDHDRGPGRSEGACVLDREMDLQVFVLVVGVIRSGGPPILLGTSLHRVFRVVVIDQPMALHDVQLF